MKKFCLLLALILLLATLAACNSEEPVSYPIPGYQLSIPPVKDWAAVEADEEEVYVPTFYDLELTKGDIHMYAAGCAITDYVDMPAVSEVYANNNNLLLAEVTEVQEVEAQSSYTVDGKTVLVTLYSGKEGNTTMYYYCFMISFPEETGTHVWVAFSAKDSLIKSNRNSLKELAESIICTGNAISFQEADNADMTTETTAPEDDE